MEVVSMAFQEGIKKLGFLVLFSGLHLQAPLNVFALSSGSLPDPELLPG